MVVVSGLCALFGFIGWRKGFPPVVMYAVAGVLFVAYHAWITHRWRKTTGFVVFTQ